MSQSIVNKVWKVLVAASVACLLFILIGFLTELNQYFKLSASAPVEILEWRPVDMGRDKFCSEANYSFEFQDNILEGHYRFGKPLFPTKAACDSTITKFQNKSWCIYFNPKDPSTAALQRLFPFKAAVHLLLSIAVVVYFVWFREYLLRLASVDS